MAALSLFPNVLIAVLATWLGAATVARAPRDYAARPFGLFTLLLALWATARTISRLSADEEVRQMVGGVEAGAAAVLPAVMLHLVLAFTVGRRWSPARRAAVAAGYALGLLIAAHSITDRTHAIAPRPPHWEVPGLPGSGMAIGWGWIGVRAALMAFAIWCAWHAWHREGRDGARRDQLAVVLAAVVVGALGGIGTILLADLRLPDWPGLLLIATGLALAAYAILARRVLLDPDLARHVFSRSLGAGVLLAAFVVALQGLEHLARHFFAIDPPLITALALVLAVALLDPARDQVRALLDRRTARRDRGYRRLLRAMGDELVAPRHPEAGIPHALAQICRALGIRAAAVIGHDGLALATYGPWSATTAVALVLPFGAPGEGVGRVCFGSKRSRLPYGEAETALLGQAAAYLTSTLRLGEQQAEQATALDTLSRERDALRSQEDALTAALLARPTAPVPDGLSVFALGPLRVERGGERIGRWGGAKAGTRQAEALFAFLFDRGERGIAKDEILDLIWPDVPLDKADPAFHRTLGGLRRTLAPALPRGKKAAIIYHHDRYHLEPLLIAWSDSAAFEERLATASAADPAATVAALEEARALYRGDYLDDCPYYGDSEFVEERRTALRDRYIDLLLALGECHEGRGDRPSAAACFRAALRAAGDDCPRANIGLNRLRRPL